MRSSLSRCSGHQQDLAGGLAALKLTLLEFDPAHLESSFKLMHISFTLKKSDMAVKIMEDAVDHSPDEPLAYYNLINTYEKCKMFDQAEEARQRLKQRFAKRSKEKSPS